MFRTTIPLSEKDYLTIEEIEEKLLKDVKIAAQVIWTERKIEELKKKIEERQVAEDLALAKHNKRIRD